MEPSSELEQHPAISPEDTVKEDQVTHGQLPRHCAKPAQTTVGAEKIHEQQGAAAKGMAFKLPYFQSKSHAASALAMNGPGPDQQAAVQQTEATHADHASQSLPSKCPRTQGVHPLRR